MNPESADRLHPDGSGFGCGNISACSGNLSGGTYALRPLHDRVLVKRLEGERKNAFVIVIQDAVAEKPGQGEVAEVVAGNMLKDGKLRMLDIKLGIEQKEANHEHPQKVPRNIPFHLLRNRSRVAVAASGRCAAALWRSGALRNQH